MSYTFFDFLQLAGSLGVFIFGMKVFSDGLQKVAGNRLRAILKGMTRNRLMGIFTGFGTTAITQSSTTTTVMVVGFVNAGLITFVESTGVIMGANIGTTVTAWMVSVFGFKFQITPVAISMIGLFFPFLFVKNEKLRNMAEAMIGFGILFIGLDFIKNSVPDIDTNPEMFAFLQSFADFGFASTLLFIVVGTVLTLLTQSSSAATAITLVMLAQGWITFPIAAAMILGENIGTTVTANIAALVGNVQAKRAARFHFFFNVIGVCWMLLVITPFLHGIDWVMQSVSASGVSVLSDDPAARTNATLALALFHTTFNILNVLLLFALVPMLVRLVEYIQPEKAGEREGFRLRYIHTGLMSSAELSLEQAQREIQQFAALIVKMHFSFTGLLLKDRQKQKGFLEKIEKREQITDQLELEIAEYLVQIQENASLSLASLNQIRHMQNMLHDLERMGDIYYEMSRTYERILEDGLDVPEDVMDELHEMLRAVHEALVFMTQNLRDTTVRVNMQKAVELEKGINNLRDCLRNRHYGRLEQGVYSPRIGVMYLDLLNRLEKVGDHIINVNESLAGGKMQTVSSI
ncbi:Na/Pi cotransporter family protein [Desulfurivibrio alkaliphilus]|uniref:Na/Pi-cotransporter II-related protein n=1 Tax=Desulfurivibrio alkaliphilus (strain DSM 19089 / UNIQEM U267 / AHT2) TaxID=589865 RepID=D6Z2Y9_DESAT|nr:Na/Pi cotransporter family protein [Desulfurivibrio alkaliphilus]ADH85914.1 Na/Pi-cotransporter II-related protein [Desulfurivibrio alkaliphilus AHT 2]